jgi:hypothetical protein
MTQNSRSLSKRRGDNANNDRETNRHMSDPWATKNRYKPFVRHGKPPMTPPEGRTSTPPLLASFLLALARRAAVEEVPVYEVRYRLPE